ncbi:hypothetical protein PVAP13_3KG242354 [Panicum virgatum]|uniref:Uncharacterized protein n=1 Tax=Panicum virgatum TaxID=38727 RepID=A0A8T0V2Y2_PANVG|nr:hypothetical protein PVAP13_3KG242354 [Panicum virgatum]KAG2628768.1 hypothetical protein PVAP13_3KG242354 [Panicum virgatum]
MIGLGQCRTEQLKKLQFICFIKGFLKVLFKGKEKKSIHLRASVKGLAMKVQQDGCSLSHLNASSSTELTWPCVYSFLGIELVARK